MENASFQIRDYLKPGCHAHLVGIGGVSMRPLGLVLRSMGMQISGSDLVVKQSTSAAGANEFAALNARGISDFYILFRQPCKQA